MRSTGNPHDSCFRMRGPGLDIEVLQLKTDNGRYPIPTGPRAGREFAQVSTFEDTLTPDEARLVEMGDTHVSTIERDFPKLIKDCRGWRVNEPLTQHQTKDRPFR